MLISETVVTAFDAIFEVVNWMSKDLQPMLGADNDASTEGLVLGPSYWPYKDLDESA